jgi:hypothetical protein
MSVIILIGVKIVVTNVKFLFVYVKNCINVTSLINTIDNVSNILWKHVVFTILNKYNDDRIF